MPNIDSLYSMDVIVVNDIKENRVFEIKLEIFHFFIHYRENLLLFIEATLIQYFLLSLVCNTPLQYSCLENPMDGGAWKAAVHGIRRVGHD